MTDIRRFLRFRLRAFLIAITSLSLLFGVLGWKVEKVRRQREAVQWIMSVGGSVNYSFEMEESKNDVPEVER